MAVAYVDLVDGPGPWHGAEGTEAEVTGDDIENVLAHEGDARAAGGIVEGVDHLNLFAATIIDLEKLRRRERRDQDFAITPNGEVFNPCSGGELVNDFNVEWEGGISPVEVGEYILRQNRNDQQDEGKYR